MQKSINSSYTALTIYSEYRNVICIRNAKLQLYLKWTCCTPIHYRGDMCLKVQTVCEELGLDYLLAVCRDALNKSNHSCPPGIVRFRQDPLAFVYFVNYCVVSNCRPETTDRVVTADRVALYTVPHCLNNARVCNRIFSKGCIACSESGSS